MRALRAILLVTVGAVIGAGLVVSADKLTAEGTFRPASGRFELGEADSAGDYPLRFIRDTKTNTCYLAGVNPRVADGRAPTYQITAITQADPIACTVK